MIEPRTIRTLLIANRGEIALRIMRTAKSLGIRTVAVHSDADATAAHVAFADAAVHIGASPASDSYLRIDTMINAAKSSGADAVHPGYGFLSENARFATACSDAGLIFVGPPAEAIEVMGDKAGAKRRMIDANVPCIPGYQGTDQSDERMIAEAREIGFPLMVKAAAGGGGRGMRLVKDEARLAAALADARSEAKSAFGDDALILEKALLSARHVEIQVFADAHGNVIHLGERDCSLQRRHQKVIEEAPCPVMTPALRSDMGEAGALAAREIGYCGAGTVEFLLDADHRFYFLEMNTRLQVEHPVTEMVTGLDLVALQIAVAEGRPLPLTQNEVTLDGWAIEARLYAEDPARNFLPASGPVHLWRPAVGPGVRVDDGIRSGDVISPFYDPMAAKIIAHGETREIARRRLIEALRNAALFGSQTNRTFLIALLESDDFIDGAATTRMIDTQYPDGCRSSVFDDRAACIAGAALYRRHHAAALARAPQDAPDLSGWFSAAPLATPFRLQSGEDVIDVSVTAEAAGLRAETNGASFLISFANDCEGVDTIRINGVRMDMACHHADGRLYLQVDGRDFAVTDLLRTSRCGEATVGDGAVLAPMHGLMTALFVKQGEEVAAGARLGVLEAMKMQHEITSPIDGVVEMIGCGPGDQVASDDLIFRIAAPN